MDVDTIDERLALFRAMADHAGVDLAALSAAVPQEVRAAAQRCLGCRDSEECHRWFETQEETAPVPSFCRNAGQFNLWKAE
ncbi:DUF6455 family protein [Ancylobacter sp.]|uniref:DUF6455 family protein n=1 Tax=Ancylobacter sp. TaxID=1872567 RepID=UPI003C7D33D3